MPPAIRESCVCVPDPADDEAEDGDCLFRQDGPAEAVASKDAPDERVAWTSAMPDLNLEDLPAGSVFALSLIHISEPTSPY